MPDTKGGAPRLKRPSEATKAIRAPWNPDGDYAHGFQALLEVGVRLRKEGRSLPLLLRKCSLELHIGSYCRARDAAVSACILDGACSEAHYLAGVSWLAVGLMRLGALAEGPGERSEVEELATDCLQQAQGELAACVRLNPTDEDAAALLHRLEAALAHRGRALQRALCDLARI